MLSPSTSSPFDREINSALAGWQDGIVLVKSEDGAGWSDREKELLRRLKGKERELGEWMVRSLVLLILASRASFTQSVSHEGEEYFSEGMYAQSDF